MHSYAVDTGSYCSLTATSHAILIIISIIIEIEIEEWVDNTVSKHPEAKGLACIICNDYKANIVQDEILCARKDSEAMESAFNHVNFATISLRNATQHKIETLIRKITCYPDYTESYQCIAIVLSGHGKNWTFVSDDGVEINIVNEIIMPFNHMNRKTKLLFIDACRKSSGQHGDIYIPSNFLIAYSTGYNSLSVGYDDVGSIWISKLASAIELLETKKSVGDVLTPVNAEMECEGHGKPIILQTAVSFCFCPKSG